MAQIHVLDSETIDKIAAGEVVERPSSVVKELVENSIDAGADAVTVEIKEGGIEFLRVTDNGSGMEKDQVQTAFLRHATSKIKNATDLGSIRSLGFRGEALSSIAAVSKVEVITKTMDSLTGIRMNLEGSVVKSFDEVGAPNGTTFIMRNLFFNTPVRRKFLKHPSTEGSYIADLMEHMALSRPDISFKFVNGNQTRFHTSGNGDLREVIYRIYGRDTASYLIPIQYDENGIKIEGYLGKPVQVRSNRNHEIYFINGRFIRSNVIAKAIEEGYQQYLMQHKFPVCMLHISMEPEDVDVNVHPSKMDVRFKDTIQFCKTVAEAVRYTLKSNEMIPDVYIGEETNNTSIQPINEKSVHTPEVFEQKRAVEFKFEKTSEYKAVMEPKADFKKSPVWSRIKDANDSESNDGKTSLSTAKSDDDFFIEDELPIRQEDPPQQEEQPRPEESLHREELTKQQETTQLNLFEEKMLSVDNRSKYRIIGQVFDTYWLIQYEDKLFIIDQHAAHEKVKYERLMKQFHEKQVVSQTLMPPIIVSLQSGEEAVLGEYMEVFNELGFEIDCFGGNEYALRSVPVDLYGCNEKEMFLEVLDELCDGGIRGNVKVIHDKIASMSCKAAVKGNNHLSFKEADALIDELLTLENPYNCPHGRPTIISMSQTELEKKFKRII